MLLGGISLISLFLACGICLGANAFASGQWLWCLPIGFLGSFLSLGLLTFLLLWFLCRIVDLSKPQEKDSKLYRTVLKLITPAAMKILLTKVHTKGLELTPKNGRFLLVCNHINDMDPVTLLAYFRKSQLAFITKRENMSMFLVGKLMHKTLCQPINRENDREALKTILKCIEILKQDKASVAVFPEGYTSMNGLLHPFRHGVFKIALKTNVPVVVCTLQNTNRIFRNALHLRPTQVHLHLIKVIQPEEYAGMTAVELGTYVHSLMAEDLGPELVEPTQEST